MKKNRLSENHVAKLLRNGYSYKDIALLEQTQTDTKGVKPKMSYAQRMGHDYNVSDEYRTDNPSWERQMQPNWYGDYGTESNPAPEGWNDPSSENFDYMAKGNLRQYRPGPNAQAIDDESQANWKDRDYVSDNPYVNKQMNYRRDVQDAGWSWAQNDPSVHGSGGMYIPTDFEGSVYDYKMTGGDSPSYGGFDAWQDRGGHESTTTWNKPTAKDETSYLANIKPAASRETVNTWMEGKTTKKLTENQVGKLLEHGYSYKDITLFEQSVLDKIGHFSLKNEQRDKKYGSSLGHGKWSELETLYDDPKFKQQRQDIKSGDMEQPGFGKSAMNTLDNIGNFMYNTLSHADNTPYTGTREFGKGATNKPGLMSYFSNMFDHTIRPGQRLSEKHVSSALNAGYSYSDIALFEQNQDESPANPGTGQYDLQPGDDNLREQKPFTPVPPGTPPLDDITKGRHGVREQPKEIKPFRPKPMPTNPNDLTEKEVFYTDEEGRKRKFDDAQ